jgi:hypothetical protein
MRFTPDLGKDEVEPQTGQYKNPDKVSRQIGNEM